MCKALPGPAPLALPGKHYPLDEAKDAIRETQAPKRGGKCFLEG
jgi:hypothetical protein